MNNQKKSDEQIKEFESRINALAENMGTTCFFDEGKLFPVKASMGESFLILEQRTRCGICSVVLDNEQRKKLYPLLLLVMLQMQLHYKTQDDSEAVFELSGDCTSLVTVTAGLDLIVLTQVIDSEENDVILSIEAIQDLHSLMQAKLGFNEKGDIQ